MIDNEHLFFVDKGYQHGVLTVYLLKLDLPRTQLSVIDTKAIGGSFPRVIFDPHNRRTFTIYISGVSSHYFHIVTVKNSRVEFSDEFKIDDFNHHFCMLKLKGT
jgi:hypothetical protein